MFTVALTPNNPNIQQGRRISKSDRCRRARASKLVDKMPGMAKDARAELPTYTLLDVAKHNSPQDAWIIVAGKVYNVTQFAQEHPGGEDVLLDSAGRLTHFSLTQKF